MTTLRITPDPKTLSQWKADGFVNRKTAVRLSKREKQDTEKKETGK